MMMKILLEQKWAFFSLFFHPRKRRIISYKAIIILHGIFFFLYLRSISVLILFIFFLSLLFLIWLLSLQFHHVIVYTATDVKDSPYLGRGQHLDPGWKIISLFQSLKSLMFCKTKQSFHSIRSYLYVNSVKNKNRILM